MVVLYSPYISDGPTKGDIVTFDLYFLLSCSLPIWTQSHNYYIKPAPPGDINLIIIITMGVGGDIKQIKSRCGPE